MQDKLNLLPSDRTTLFSSANDLILVQVSDFFLQTNDRWERIQSFTINPYAGVIFLSFLDRLISLMTNSPLKTTISFKHDGKQAKPIQRLKAPGTPPSTVTMQPVVLSAFDEAKNAMDSAMSSGNIFTSNVVRFL